MQRLIDAWNRKTYLQTYWDPPTGGKLYGKRLGSISDDEQFYMCQTLGSDGSSLEPPKQAKYDSMRNITDPGKALPFEDDDYVYINENPESYSSFVSKDQFHYPGILQFSFEYLFALDLMRLGGAKHGKKYVQEETSPKEIPNLTHTPPGTSDIKGKGKVK